jgi:thiol:disulfide interchange protein
MIKKYQRKLYKNTASKLSLLLFFGLFSISFLQGESFSKESDSSLTLSASSFSMEPNNSILVGLEFELNKGWHTYWKNPGDAGGEASVVWELPLGFTASEILWPGPDPIPVEPLMTFGYEDRVTLLTKISTSSIASFPANISAQVSWYTCKDICIPQDASVDILITKGPLINSRDSSHLASVNKELPEEFPGTYRVEYLNEKYYLQAELTDSKSIESAYYFPEKYGITSYSEKQSLEVNDKNISLEIIPAKPSIQHDSFTGVLNIKDPQGDNYYFIDQKLPNSIESGSMTDLSILTAIFFAFLGGLILNVMPCVFPILSIKILNFVEQSEGSRKLMMQHGITFTAGVLVTFLSIAGLLLLLKSGGESIGWGYQLQSPLMVTLLIYLFVAIGIVFMSSLVLGSGLASLSLMTRGYQDLTGSFLTGVLAVIVASPCTAPFMGSALGIALLQPGLSSIAIFVSLGLGFATPYLILSFSPSLLAFLPKPGPWMENLKQFMAFPMWGSALWLTWVLSGQVKNETVMLVLLGALLIAISLWLIEKIQTSEGLLSWFIKTVAVSLVGLALWIAPTSYADTAGDEVSSEDVYSQAVLDNLLNKQKLVFLNFTADWCITCKVNEAVSLKRKSVKLALKNKEITYLKADWTRKDPIIAKKLAEFGRTGVPLYLLYSSSGEPKILPELLTEETLLGYIDELN